MILDDLAPMLVGSESLALTYTDASAERRAFYPVDLDVDYAGAGDDGVRLPLELLVQGPSSTSFYRHIFSRFVPSQVSFAPKEGGQFLVLLREVGHNRLLGRIVVEIEGEQADPP